MERKREEWVGWYEEEDDSANNILPAYLEAPLQPQDLFTKRRWRFLAFTNLDCLLHCLSPEKLFLNKCGHHGPPGLPAFLTQLIKKGHVFLHLSYMSGFL